MRDWYPAKELTDGSRAALICQRSSVAWGQRLHREYAWLLGGLATTVGAIGIGIAAVRGMTLADYLISIFMPSLPALLDAVDFIRAHLTASRVKGELEAEMTESLLAGNGVDFGVCRSFQDRLFTQRGADPVVAEPYYRLRRREYEKHMIEAAEDLARGEGEET